MTRVLITGSTDGIGLRTAQVLADRGHQVVLHGRSQQRLDRARDSLGDAAAGALIADLSDLDQVADLAAAAQEQKVDMLINNAAVYRRERALTRDGHEWMWAVNHLAPSLLTALLLPSLPDHGRVVYVSTTAHGRGTIDLSDPNFARRRWNHQRAHLQTKLANLLMVREWARRQDRVTFLAVHPGTVGTKLLTEGFGMEGTDSLDEGASTSVFAAIDPAAADQSGAFLVRSAVAEPQPRGRDDAMAAALFDYTMRELGLTSPS